MGYLQCQKCGGYYKLNEGESLDDFTQCSCGGSLVYTETIAGLKPPENESGKTKNNPQNTSANPGKSEDNPENINKSAGKSNNNNNIKSPNKHSEVSKESNKEFNKDLKEVNSSNKEVVKDPVSSVNDMNDSKKSNEVKQGTNEKNQHSKQLSNIGIIIMFTGFICMIFAFFYPFLFLGGAVDNQEYFTGLFMQTIGIYLISVILMILGVVIFLIANIGKGSKKKHTKSRVGKDNLKELPGNYTIFQNVRIPKTRSLIGQIIIGPHGIFIIQNRALKGEFIIRDEEWWRLKGNQRIKPVSNPAKLVKMNAIHLKRFLNSHNVSVEYAWIIPVVSIASDQYTVDEEPRNYNLVPPENITEFIINQKKTMDPELMMRTLALIAPFSN